MADFSLTTVFVAPVAQTALPSSGSTQNLTAGQIGLFRNDYSIANSGNIAAAPYFYIAQGRANTYLLGSKRSDKIKGCPSGSGCKSNVTEWYKVAGCGTPVNQITDITGFNVQCGDVVTLTLRGFSSYLNTLYFNGLTRSVTVQAPCCECGDDPCTTVDESALIDLFIEKLEAVAPGINPDNIGLTKFFTFENVGGTILRITGKALTAYGQPCDVAAFPHEYDRLFFRAFVYAGPATTADFIVSDSCNIVATATTVQNSTYATGTSEEIKQLEKNHYSYQAGYLKHLYRQMGWNQNFESYVSDGTVYDTFYIKFRDYDAPTSNTWGDYIDEDNMVIIAVPKDSVFETALETALEAALGSVAADNTCATTTTTTTSSTTTTTTTTKG